MLYDIAFPSGGADWSHNKKYRQDTHLGHSESFLFIIHYFFFTQGAEADPRDIEGQTPLFLAASVGGTETVQLLMDRGADITLKDMELRSALHVAIGNTSTMDALMKVPTSQHY